MAEQQSSVSGSLSENSAIQGSIIPSDILHGTVTPTVSFTGVVAIPETTPAELPEISEATAGMFLTNDGEEAFWQNNISDKNYVFTQYTASNVWEITHNLNKYPAISVVDSGGTEVIGDVQYDSVNKCTITFSASFSGQAFFN